MKNIISLIILCLLSACAPPLDTGPMRPSLAIIQELSAPEGLQRNIEIANVTVPEEFNTSDIGSINSATLKSVLTDTLYSAGYAINAKLIDGDPSTEEMNSTKYTLDASLIELSTPLFGIDMDAKCVIAYKLTRAQDGNVVWEENITQGYLATFGQAFVATERARIAQANAVGENISHLLRLLHQMELDEPKPTRSSRRGHS